MQGRGERTGVFRGRRWVSVSVSLLPAEHRIYLDRQSGGFLVPALSFHGLATAYTYYRLVVPTRTRTYLREYLSCESCGILLRTEWYKYDAAWCKLQHPILHVSKSEVLR